MANSIIRIKRSGVAGNPSTLAAGELAYSAANADSVSGGDRLYVGFGAETNGNAANHFVIGGKYFTDMMNHAKGTLTADSAIIVDSNKKINELLVDNLSFDGNTISSTDTNGDINLVANGTGSVVINNAYSLPATDGNAGQFLKTDGIGNLTFAAVPSGSFDITGDSGTDTFTTGQTLNFSGAGAITTTVTDNDIEISVPNAGSSVKGVASFSSADFNINDGAISAKDITLGSTALSLGSTVLSLSGLESLDVDNINIDGNTITSTDVSGNIIISPDGAGQTVVSGLVIDDGTTQRSIQEYVEDITGGQIEGTADAVSVTYNDTSGTTTIDLVETTVTAGSYGSATEIPTFTVDADGRLTAASTVSVATTLAVAGDSGTSSVDLLSDTLTLAGANNISTSVDSGTDTVTISVTDATTSQKGIASFDTSDFTVSSGAVSAKDITLGTTTLSLGSSTGVLEGLESLDVDNLNIDGNTITATNTNGGISLLPNGTGHVSVNDSLIQDVNDPIDPKDAANKRYVDEVAQGLQAKPADDVATTAALTATFDGGAGTLTATVNGVFPTVDGYDLQLGETILVKNQTNAYENGSYELTQIGDASNPWVLTRATLIDETDEVPGAFEFIINGTQFGNSGFVATVPSDFLINSTDPTTDGNGFTTRGDIVWVQFSGAGTFTAGDALTLDGNEFNVNLATNSGLLISSDELQVNSTIAGNGLTFSNGVINVVGSTDRIDVTSNQIDIASTYAGQASIDTLGTITTGTWNGSIISPTFGGTGVNNGSNTLTLGGNLTTSGASSVTLTSTSTTNVTLPTSGTLATLAGTETLENKTIESSSIGAVTPSTGAFTDLTASGDATFTNTDDASSTTTGALVVSGGVGIGKKLYVGTDIEGSGAATSSLNGFNIDGGTY